MILTFKHRKPIEIRFSNEFDKSWFFKMFFYQVCLTVIIIGIGVTLSYFSSDIAQKIEDEFYKSGYIDTISVQRLFSNNVIISVGFLSYCLFHDYMKMNTSEDNECKKIFEWFNKMSFILIPIFLCFRNTLSLGLGVFDFDITNNQQVNIIAYIALLIPHGFFELISLLLMLSFYFYCYKFRVIDKNKGVVILKTAIFKIALINIVLTLLAAVIEAHYSGGFMKFVVYSYVKYLN